MVKVINYIWFSYYQFIIAIILGFIVSIWSIEMAKVIGTLGLAIAIWSLALALRKYMHLTSN